MGFGKCQRAHRKPVERFKQGRECRCTTDITKALRMRYRSFFWLCIGWLLGRGSYHRFMLTGSFIFWYKALNELDFFELVEK
ncbi:hypothetical protein C3D72_19165 [Cronobacter sakazakii]|nr:hypothetical protein C3D72_19165 [Cronobacter sakazakii]